MMSVFKDKAANLPDLAKSYLFTIEFFDKELERWNNELSIRINEFRNESVIEFNEFQDFYVSKFFDEHDRLLQLRCQS